MKTPLRKASLEETLTEAYPSGHPGYKTITLEELQLHSDKNHDYAAGGDPLGNFKRVAAFFTQYPNLSLTDPAVVALAFAMKQVDAYCWLKSNGHEAMMEGLDQRLLDITIYTKLARLLEREAIR
jgi:hypothetical protein